MNAQPRIAIVVPCYNEERRLNVEAFCAFASAHPDIGFLFIDDGSRDATWEVMQKLAASSPGQLRAMQLPKNSGKAEAVRRGMLAAMEPHGEESPPDFIGFWDADLATPLEAIPDFLQIFAARPQIDMVFGSRVKLLGRTVHRKATRHYIGRVFATIAATLLGLAIYDTQCGAKIFRNTDEFRKVCATPFLSRWIFDVEMIARYLELRRGGGKPMEDSIYEFPLQSWADVAGSKLKMRDFITVLRDLARIGFRYKTR